jgi:hypothetical protein
LIASDSIRCRSSRSDRNRWLTNATQTDLRLHFSMELIDVFVGFVSWPENPLLCRLSRQELFLSLGKR